MKLYYPSIAVSKLCGLFGKTRQAYYKLLDEQEQESMEIAIVLALVTEIRSSMPQLGTRKLYYLLQDDLTRHRIKLGRDQLFDILADHGLLLKRKRRRARTTNSQHWLRKYPNLIRHLEPSRPNELWVSDITYIAVADGFSYLSLVTDAYSRKIVGYCLNGDLTTAGPLQALTMALEQRIDDQQPWIHHSDRGIQYCSGAYVALLNKHKALISMTEHSDPYENAKAERVNGILKTEFSLSKVFQTNAEACEAVHTAVEIYNRKRPHASCNYLTPEEAHTGSGVLAKRWKSYAASTNYLSALCSDIVAIADNQDQD